MGDEKTFSKLTQLYLRHLYAVDHESLEGFSELMALLLKAGQASVKSGHPTYLGTIEGFAVFISPEKSWKPVSPEGLTDG